MVIVKGRRRAREPLSEADFCLLEILLKDEIKNCEEQIKHTTSKDLVALLATGIERYTQLLKRLYALT